MSDITRKEFLTQAGLASTSLLFLGACSFDSNTQTSAKAAGVVIDNIKNGEDVFTYINRIKGKLDFDLYRQLIGAANAFKEGDKTLGVAASDETSRQNARALLYHTTIDDLNSHVLHQDDLLEFIQQSTQTASDIRSWSMGELKAFVLNQPEEKVKEIMPSLTSDNIACLVKLLSNEELIQLGQKIFNPLKNSKIGSKGYLSARVQPNSPTDNVDDICWQVFDAWSYAVGDLVLGTNPVSSEPKSVAKIEAALLDILQTFELENVMPNCVLSHIDIQAEVEKTQAGSTGIWFQSLAGTVAANQTFDVSIDKMVGYAEQRKGKYGLYAETGQGADFTNGHGEGFDMVVHEARKYGFVRALKTKMPGNPWTFVNDVAGFIGPEVFRSKEQLVRCCLEDIVMGKLHGLPIGLDICSTLHMDINLEDLEWCIDQIMPANPAYLMALPTKNDPMLSYLTTAFNDHLRVRKKFGYKVNDAMWDFFKRIEVIDENGEPTEHFGDPLWVYYQFCKAKNDIRSKEDIYKEGRSTLKQVRGRGVSIAEGYGENYWDLNPSLNEEVHLLYEDAKKSLWSEMTPAFVGAIPNASPILTKSADRKDYVYHPESGEALTSASLKELKKIRTQWGNDIPDVQIIVSDGLNARALMDDDHLLPFLRSLQHLLEENHYSTSASTIVVTNGRVRAGYEAGEILFGNKKNAQQPKGIIHIIGERPGSGHHNFSAYLTVAGTSTWNKTGTVDHDISRVVSGISNTALVPEKAAGETMSIFNQMFSGYRERLSS